MEFYAKQTKLTSGVYVSALLGLEFKAQHTAHIMEME